MHLPEGTLLQNGRYKIVRFIKSGGFGCTYEGVQTLMDVRVAIKELFVGDFCNRESDNTVRVGIKSKEGVFLKLKQRFIKEATVLFKLQHQNIVRVTDVFEDNGTAYYVMDYIDGRSLADMVPKGTKLNEQEALDYIHQICDALKYVHSQNILHLDLKPGNIMVTNNGKAILIDFGASKYYDNETGEQTSTLLGIHSKPYSPLEQLDGSFKTFNPAVDIYAIGATLYRILTGIVPLTALERLRPQNTLAPLPSNISQPTRNAIEAAMQIESEKRPQSIKQLEDIWNKVLPNYDQEKTIIENAIQSKDASNSKNKINRELIQVKSVTEKEATVIDDKNKNTTSSKPQTNKPQTTKPETTQKSTQEKKKATYVPNGSINGHEYIDLGLPSGLLWATCNVGASKHSDYGDYFAWGEIQTKSSYTEKNSETCGKYGKWYQKKIDKDNLWLFKNGYIDGTGILTFSHDVARQNWGGLWRMPTKDEIQELIDNTIPEWTTRNGVKGYLVKSKKNGNSIFMPAAGSRIGFSLWKADEYGCFWSSMSDMSIHGHAYCLLFNFKSRIFKVICEFLSRGHSVRPVSDRRGEITTPLNSQTNQELQKETQIALSTINGYEYVDLGLPSGLKWATSNVGALSPEQNGSYFTWGEIRPKSSYNENNREAFGKDKQWLVSKGYIGENGNLSMPHDAARQNWGGSWRIPTLNEIRELVNNTTTEWTTRKGVKGRLVKSKINGNSIFLPATGWSYDSSLKSVGEDGRYWCSTPYTTNSYTANHLDFNSSHFDLGGGSRECGLAVRPVSD